MCMGVNTLTKYVLELGLQVCHRIHHIVVQSLLCNFEAGFLRSMHTLGYSVQIAYRLMLSCLGYSFLPMASGLSVNKNEFFVIRFDVL
jgi:hypothetical protein